MNARSTAGVQTAHTTGRRAESSEAQGDRAAVVGCDGPGNRAAIVAEYDDHVKFDGRWFFAKRRCTVRTAR
ncbi:MAG: hypothetical protein ACKO91_15365 [Acidimicrobiales bacterium]